MTKQTTTISVLVIAGFLAIVLVHVLQTKDAPIAVASSATPMALPPEKKLTAVAALPPKATPVTTDASVLGKARGSIVFISGNGSDAKKVTIRLQARSAIGVWQPAKNRMRILLLESEPGSDEAQALLITLQAGGEPAINATRHAMVELTFVPTAQAFDRNDLETATLIVRDGALTSTANALNGLSWNGSLPSPQVTPPPGFDFPQVELTSDGNAEAVDSLEWRQSWHVSLSVPVIMRD